MNRFGGTFGHKYLTNIIYYININNATRKSEQYYYYELLLLCTAAAVAEAVVARVKRTSRCFIGPWYTHRESATDLLRGHEPHGQRVRPETYLVRCDVPRKFGRIKNKQNNIIILQTHHKRHEFHGVMGPWLPAPGKTSHCRTRTVCGRRGGGPDQTGRCHLYATHNGASRCAQMPFGCCDTDGRP